MADDLDQKAIVQAVTLRGGFDAVNDADLWGEVATGVGLPRRKGPAVKRAYAAWMDDAEPGAGATPLDDDSRADAGADEDDDADDTSGLGGVRTVPRRPSNARHAEDMMAVDGERFVAGQRQLRVWRHTADSYGWENEEDVPEELVATYEERRKSLTPGVGALTSKRRQSEPASARAPASAHKAARRAAGPSGKEDGDREWKSFLVLRGEVPDEVCARIEGPINADLDWLVRFKDATKVSVIDNETMRSKYPELLLDWYEARVQVVDN